MRNTLIRLAVRYEGNYFRIRKAIRKKEHVPSCQLQQAITILDDDYPEEFRRLKYPPYVLFYEGRRELLKNRKLAVVGSRDVSEYGVMVTSEIVSRIRERFTIVSGMARGIDTIAHSNALNTIAVIGCGIDVPYPKANSELYEYMKKNQLIISEYPLGTAPRKHHFPFRNRLIAALGESLIVTQATMKSGAMITVNEALQLGKEVYTVPYRLTDSEGSGCNWLLSQGARMIKCDS